ncbi:MAG: hypothetical protein HY020_07230 [Burkholderiales bacterium]|nr:hypothetical protein [Burkholderiales bacterium]
MLQRSLIVLLLPALLAACATVREARMAVPASVAGVAEESFGKPGWGRQGEFTLHGERVRYERGADRLALFGSLAMGRATLRYTWSPLSGDSTADCTARQAELTTNSLSATIKPWTLNCQWSGRPDATLQIGEGQVRRGKLTREGSYRRGELTLGLRSVHLFEGSPLPQTNAVGYEMLYQGTVVGSLDLSGSVPRLRRPDPATPLGRAVTEAALALALVWEPGS